MDTFRQQADQLSIHQIEEESSFDNQPCFGQQQSNNNNTTSTYQQQHQLFKRSSYHTTTNNNQQNKLQKMNIKQLYIKQKLALLTIQNHLLTIFGIYQRKVINIKRSVFNNIKHTIDGQQLMYRQQCMVGLLLGNVFDKIASHVQKRRVKLLAKGFGNILLFSANSNNRQQYYNQSRTNSNINNRQLIIQRKKINNNYNTNNTKKLPSNKRTSQIRARSQLIDDNESAFNINNNNTQQLAQSNITTTNSMKIKNKQLKKVKKQHDQNLTNFYSQFDQMLTMHQQYLKKK